MRIVLAVALLAPLAAAPAAADPGEAAYQEACASCHHTPARFMRRYLDLSPADRQAALDSFLKTHYAEDDARRAAIIAWLEANHVPR
jgi:cytochrome c2